MKAHIFGETIISFAFVVVADVTFQTTREMRQIDTVASIGKKADCKQ